MENYNSFRSYDRWLDSEWDRYHNDEDYSDEDREDEKYRRSDEEWDNDGFEDYSDEE